MYYALVIDNNIVLGPRMWSWSAFKDYMEEESIDFSQLPRSAPDQPVVTGIWKILPASSPTMPTSIDEPYEQLAGPYWTVYENHIEGYYSTAPTLFDTVKGTILGNVAFKRYMLENLELKIEINGVKYTVFTKRGEYRDAYTLKYLQMNDGDQIVWKFPQGFATITKQDLKSIIDLINNHVQSLFDWESEKQALINNATTNDDIRSIDITHPLEYKLAPDYREE